MSEELRKEIREYLNENLKLEVEENRSDNIGEPGTRVSSITIRLKLENDIISTDNFYLN